MAKMRVYDLANDLGIEIDRAMRLLREVGADPRNHMSSVERVPARRVRQLLKQNKNAALPPTQIQTATAAPVEAPAQGAEVRAVGSAAQVESPPSQAEPVPKERPAAAAPQQAPASGEQKARGGAPRAVAAPEPQTTAPVVEPPRVQAPKLQTPSAERATPKETRPVESSQPAEATPAAQATRAPERQATVSRPAGQGGSRQTPPRPTQEASKPQPSTAARRPKRTGGEDDASTSTTRPKRQQDRPGSTGERGRTSEAPAGNRPPGRAAGQRSASPGGPPGRGTQENRRRPAGQGNRPGGAGGNAARHAGGPPGTGPTRGRRTRPRTAQAKDVAGREAQAVEAKPTGPLLIPDNITVQDLAEKLNIPATAIIMNLMAAGVMASINQRIEHEVAAAVAEKLGFEVRRPEVKRVAQMSNAGEADDKLVSRPPVVTIMGHVDHGKTTLLDVIRRAKVAEGEAGGITQHIGAYQAEVNGKKITFLDTPGHEAFTSMRSRGAQVTDIAILVVAADDGVMPQTIEAINHAKAADVPIIVAVNKMDREGANPDRVKQQLADHGLVPEEWGGETICVPVSAIQREGIDELLEMVLLVAEMRELKANPTRRARGVVVEAELDKTRGPVATVLVQTGTMRLGDSIVAGAVFGRVRAMFDEWGNSVEEAGPSRPVAILGLADVPKAGDLVESVEDDKAARTIATERADSDREEETQRGAGRIRLSEIFSKSQAGDVKDLNLLIKADVQGSVEALRQSIEKLSNDEVRVNVIHSGVGGVNESDISLAAASNAIVIGFNVRPETAARRSAEREGVEIRLYRVIYEAIDEIQAAMVGLLEPTYEEVVIGRAEVRATFRVPNIGLVAGCYVTEGKLVRQAEARLIRDHVVIHEGKIASLRRFKDDVREVNEGYECGLSFERFSDIKEGDVVEMFRMEEVKRG